MRIIVDACLSPLWADFLKAHGHEACHWDKVGPMGAPDVEIIAKAVSVGAAVLTLDRDFGESLRATSAAGPSVIQLRMRDAMPETLGPRLVEFIAEHGAMLEAGAFGSLSRNSSRILPLPFGGETTQGKERVP